MNPIVSADQKVFALRHLETQEFICLLQDNKDYLACFTNLDSAYDFRNSLGLIEFVDVKAVTINDVPFAQVWIDGVNVQIKD